MKSASESPASGEGAPATPDRLRERVEAGIRRWRSRRPTHAHGSASHTDPALAYLDELKRTPLGREWLRENPFADDLKIASSEPGIVGPLPRRKLIHQPKAGSSTPPMARKPLSRAGFLPSIGRLLLWLLGGLQFVLGNLLDKLLRRDSIRRRAVRMRTILERLGPTFVKFGQQLSVRADLLPYEFCEELAGMLDRVRPFPSEEAIAAVERAVGRPLAEVFAVFDPEPVGSASVACVYQALLMNGERVAVKVRRPRIVALAGADMRALGWMLRVAEAFGRIRPGEAALLTQEFASMLFDELDFRQEARNTDLFRQEALKLNSKILSAPRVYFELCGDDVVVTEFVNGLAMTELLSAVDRNDQTALQEMKKLGIDPIGVCQNMMQAQMWETTEALLFHADPHPANMFVLPGNAIVLIDFGCCSAASNKLRRQFRQVQYAIAQRDVAAMVDASLAMMEPLPPVDIDRFAKELEIKFREWIFDLESRHAQWWEKSTAQAWFKMVALARRYEIPMRVDTLRAARLTFIYDSIAFRLWPQLDLGEQFRLYVRKAGKRIERRMRKWVRTRLSHGLTSSDFFVLSEAGSLLAQGIARVQRSLDLPTRHFGYVVGKAAYLFSVAIQMATAGLIFLALTIAGTYVYERATGQAFDIRYLLSQLSGRPLALALVTISILVLRKLRRRLTDVEVEP